MWRSHFIKLLDLGWTTYSSNETATIAILLTKKSHINSSRSTNLLRSGSGPHEMKQPCRLITIHRSPLQTFTKIRAPEITSDPTFVISCKKNRHVPLLCRIPTRPRGNESAITTVRKLRCLFVAIISHLPLFSYRCIAEGSACYIYQFPIWVETEHITVAIYNVLT